jgi:aldose 1-epimerase
MTTSTTLPGVQLYTGNHLTPRKGKNGAIIDRHAGVCLETQVWPNAMAHPHFPSPILRAGEQYHTETVYRFDIQS